MIEEEKPRSQPPLTGAGRRAPPPAWSLPIARLTELTDEAAFRQAVRNRDRAAWGQLATLYHEALCRQARLILPPYLDPENAVGDMWMKALQAARSYDPARPLYPWLARICVNTSLNQRKSLLRLLPGGAAWDVAAPSSDGMSEDWVGARGALWMALRRLPRRQRETVALRYLFGVSVGEIALLRGVMPHSVRRTLLRGLERLRTAEDIVKLGFDGPVSHRGA